jgi:hypothetical protein
LRRGDRSDRRTLGVHDTSGPEFIMSRGAEDGLGVRAHLHVESERSLRYMLASHDTQEGLRALVEKRKPRLEGR